jgi:hypothetical protein
MVISDASFSFSGVAVDRMGTAHGGRISWKFATNHLQFTPAQVANGSKESRFPKRNLCASAHELPTNLDT